LERICPIPASWNQIFERLLDYAGNHACTPGRPPTPLILAGWNFSNDTEKAHRWNETVAWAEVNGCAAIVEGIPDADFYQVDKRDDRPRGPFGGPCYRPWDFEAKERPSREDIATRLESLSAQWADIAGPNLGAATRPLAFTGKKARRLVVSAEETAVSPWGDWTRLSSDESKRRTFTRFRRAVNAALAPHEVDHIDFIAKSTT
jgi:hypothetical protein